MPESTTFRVGYTSARLALQRVATHVLARARFVSEERFGLRVTSGGIGTPAHGPDGVVLRIAGVPLTGAVLIREFRADGAARSSTTTLAGRSLQQLAEFAGLDLASSFSAGPDTTPLGDTEAPIELDAEAASTVMAWLRVGAEAIDQVLPGALAPSVAQLWPEHFDLGIDVATRHGRVNLGASPGDADHLEPYLYISPWEASRPGDPAFWNASFGAVRGGGTVLSTSDPVERAVAFFGTGLSLLG